VLIYLSGSIEFSSDYGKSWRAEITPMLRALGYEVYDPAADEQKNLTDEEVAHFREWKTSDPERFAQAVRKIVHWDLDIVEQQADALVCYWDEHAGKGAGTQAEVTSAFRHGKPVYLVTPLPRERISGWILACVTRVFPGFRELEGFLEHGRTRKKQRKGTEGSRPEGTVGDWDGGHMNPRLTNGTRGPEGLLHGELTGLIMACAVRVHRTLGPGFLERVYKGAMVHELRKAGVAFEVEKHLKVFYDGVVVGEYIADMDVEEKVILEFKSCERISWEHEAQLLNYLQATKRRLGMLLNFGGSKLESKRKIK
jgi:GxxExxY protein